jgi:hypothetical protein
LKLRERSGAGRFPFRFEADGTPQDPWGTAYVYERIGSSYKLKSLGSDGREGGRGTAADIDFPPTASAAHLYIEPMTRCEFMRDHATLAVIGTSVLAGGCTFLVGAAGSFSRRRDVKEPMTAFFVAIILAGVLSVFVGGFLAAWHVPVGEHH